MILIDKETCAGCQRCCHGTPENYLLAHLHNGKHPKIDKNHNCNQLSNRNKCGAKHGKPVECAIFPIIIADGKIYVDMGCPAWKEAVRQWDEQFGRCIDDYNYSRDDHKFVDLWIAQATMGLESHDQ